MRYDRLEGKILGLDKYPNYFRGLNNFNREILQWLEYKEFILLPLGKA